jgi:hypothetical protein
MDEDLKQIIYKKTDRKYKEHKNKDIFKMFDNLQQ